MSASPVAIKRTCCVGFKSQFSMSRVAPTTNETELPWQAQFGYSPLTQSAAGAVAIRVFLYAVMQAGMIASLVETIQDGQGAWWLCYLTNWTITLQVFSLLVAAVGTYLIRYQANYANQDAMPLLIKVVMALRAIVAPGTLVVVAVYWGGVYSGGPVSYHTVWVHGVNFAVTLFDIFLSFWEYPLAHYMYCLAYGVTYVVWTAIHYALDIGNGQGDRYVYSILDWANPVKTAIVGLVVAFVVLPLFTLIIFGLTKFRDHALFSKQRAAVRALVAPALVLSEEVTDKV